MPNKQDYLAALRAAITKLHGCGSVWVRTEHLKEEFHGQTVWEGDIEVFDLMQHPKAKRGYAWGCWDPKENKTDYVAVLELPPIKDARTAVQASIVARPKTPQS